MKQRRPGRTGETRALTSTATPRCVPAGEAGLFGCGGVSHIDTTGADVLWLGKYSNDGGNMLNPEFYQVFDA